MRHIRNTFLNETSSAVLETKTESQQGRAPPVGAKFSKEYWYPKLSKGEWSLLNATLDKELYSKGNFITDSVKWLYASRKGDEVFAIYGVGDGTEATVLYASGTKYAQLDSTVVEDLERDVQNGIIRGTKAYNRRIKDLRSKKRRYNNNELDAKNRGATVAAVGLSGNSSGEPTVVGNDNGEGSQNSGGNDGRIKHAKTSLDVKTRSATDEVKFSRGRSYEQESERDRKIFLIRNFSGEVKFDYADVYLNQREVAMIRSAVKSGNGLLNRSKKAGSVFAYDNYYLFDFNSDYSITIKDVLNMVEDQEKIRLLEETFNDENNREGTRRKVYKSSEDFGKLKNGAANGKNNNDGIYSETRTTERIRTMDSKESSKAPENGQRRYDFENRKKRLGNSFHEINEKTSLDVEVANVTPEQASLVSDVQDSVRVAVHEELNRMGEEYGWIPKGEKTAREVILPKKTADDKYVEEYKRSCSKIHFAAASLFFICKERKEDAVAVIHR